VPDSPVHRVARGGYGVPPGLRRSPMPKDERSAPLPADYFL